MNKLGDYIPCMTGGNQEQYSDRTVHANDAEVNKTFKYVKNCIKTSKYNVITFLPMNLFEQFQRAANLYFLLQIIIMSIPQITSLNPSSTAVPLTLVILATMVKDGWDDYGRHSSDNTINNKKTHVLTVDGRLEVRKWQNVETGDIIQVLNDEPVAADILVLSTGDNNNLCFIETADLDGETNLKVRQPLTETAEVLTDINELSRFKGDVTCELPNNRLDKFQGNLNWNEKVFSLDNSNIVLRGCIIRNTPCVYGLVVYAGHDSKLMMNSGKGVFKRTKLDRMTNNLVIWIAGLLAIICTFCSVMSYIWERETGKIFQSFLPWESFYDESPALIALINWPGFIMVLNTLIPISLYISVEFIRLGQSLLIKWDIHLYHKETDTPAVARNTTLSEELGQIQYIFSDKTGTLTQNVMVFKECSINGRLYGHTFENTDGMIDDISSIDDNLDYVDFSDNKYADPAFQFTDKKLMKDIKSDDHDTCEFFKLLALCHTVMVEDKRNKVSNGDSLDGGLDQTDFVPCSDAQMPLLEYQAQSPDEGALVSAARNFGFVFKDRTPQTITVERNGFQESYELLCILDFDNVRKRMSVIVRSHGKIMLYCKGADTIMYDLLSQQSDPIKTSTQQHLDLFACEGLRTLCLAYKELSEEEYNEWFQMYRAASTSMDDREEEMMVAYCAIEKDLILMGATAIEDKLQDGVPDTIHNLAEANIKIWVLTGDKQETAINIGYSSMLLTENMADVFIIDGSDEATVRQQISEYQQRIHNFGTINTGSDLEQNGSSSVKVMFNNTARRNSAEVELQEDVYDAHIKDGFALVISGKSLAFALKKEIELDFLELAKSCKAVICCRVTPLQKALVVELVKRNVKATTLAIGDGANDVSMIKAAHIGIGISGLEGRQAVLSSDFSFAQFRFLERLLLVHGRWSYWRMAKFLNYFFYKNFAFTLVQFWYNIFCGFSAQTLYDTWYLSVYNVCFTSLPVLAMGIFDQDVNDKNCLLYPKLYIPGQKNILFNNTRFVMKLLHGTLTSLAVYFIAYGIFFGAVDSDGLDHGSLEFLAVVVGGVLVIIVNIQMALDTSHWTWINHFFIWGSIVFYFIYTFVLYSAPLFNFLPSTFPAVGAAVNTFGNGGFWAALFVTCVVCIVPVVAFRWCQQKLYPTLSDLIRRGMWKEKRSRSSLLFLRKSRQSLRARPGSHRSGYAFSQQSGFGEMIMSGQWLPKLPFKSKSKSFNIDHLPP